MKWIVVGLVVLGLIAAVSAAFMTGILRASSLQSVNLAAVDVDLVVAARDLRAPSIIEADSVRVEKVPKTAAPKGFVSDPTQVIGEVLLRPVVEGQAFRKAWFTEQSNGPRLAAGVLESGMRAVTISLSGSAGLRGILYPGCVVDVLASFTLPTASNKLGKAISTTLLQNVQVIAVGEQTMAPAADEEDGKKKVVSTSSSGMRDFQVSFMVTPQQAEALQLATKYGEVSLSMRNPFDRAPVDGDVTLLSQGRLAQMAYVLDPTTLTEREKKEFEQAGLQEKSEAEEAEQAAAARNGSATGARAAPIRTPPQWEISIIRGTSLETRKFPLEAGAQADE